MALYRTLFPVTYQSGNKVVHITKSGVIINLDAAQAAGLAGKVVYVGDNPVFPRAEWLYYDSVDVFPPEGGETYLYVARDDGTIYQWSHGDGYTMLTAAGVIDEETLAEALSEAIDDVIGEELDGKANVVHTHAPSDITGLAAAMTKLTGIESGADVTDAANVAAAGAFMATNVVDEDDMASNSATKVPTQQSVKAYVDANAGGGGGTVAPTRPANNICVAIGDSITEYGGFGFFYAPFLGPNYMNLLNIETNQRIRWGGTYAVGGYTLTQIRDNKLPEVLALDPKPGACIISGGTNDVANVGGAWSLAYSSGVVLDIVDALQAAGIAPILTTIPPHGENTSFNPAVYEYNNWVRRYATTHGLFLLDIYAAVAGDDGAMKDGWSGDGIHPNQLGHNAIVAKAIADGLPELFPPGGLLTARSVDDLTNLVNDGDDNQGLFAADSNEDGVADGWTKTGTGTVSLVAPDPEDDLYGNWQKISRTTGATTGDCTVSHTVDTDYWAPGDVVCFAARVRTTGIADSEAVWWLGLSSTVDGGFTYPDGTDASSAASGVYQWETDTEGTLYVEFEVPADTTALKVEASIGAVAGTGTATLEIGEVTVRNYGPAEAAPTITTTSLNALTQGLAFSQALLASGTTPITWDVTSGSLPAGLSLSSAGVLSGTPSASGAYSFTVTAENSVGTDTQAYSGSVSTAVAPTITTTALNTLTEGVSFSQTLVATGSATITWAVTDGDLPDGLSLNTSTGAITGTPTTAGEYSFTVTATNSAGSDDQAFSGTVETSSDLAGILLGEWKFASDNLNDSSGNGHNGTFSAGSGGGTLTYGTGHTTGTRGVTFGSETNSISLGRTGLEATADGITIMGWIRLNGAPGNEILGLMSKARAFDSTRHRVSASYSGGTKSASCAARWKDDFHLNVGSDINDTNWHHIALVDGNTRWCLYVDGNQSVNGLRSFDNSSSPTGEDFPWVIGANENILDVFADEVMSVSCVRIIQGQLTQEEVQDWMNTP